MMIPAPVSRLLRMACVAVLCLGFALRLPAEPAKKSFDVPAGDAATTLKTFTQQSGEQIVYPVEQVRGIRTNAVKGEFPALNALEKMLDQTGLVAVQDGKSGAIAVNKIPAVPAPAEKNADRRPAGRGAAQTESGALQLEDYVVQGIRAPGPVNEGVIPRAANRAVAFQVFDRNSIENSGANSLGEFFRNYSGNTSTGLGYQSAFGNATNLLNGPGDTADRINLRGLGNNRTVVLLNGRRLYGSDTLGPDVSRIPLNAVERVEILSGAAAAIYGANAVGGAVNIITRRNYNVNEVTGYVGTSTQGGGTEWRGTLYSGFSLKDGRTSGSVILEHSDRSALRASQREFYLDAIARIPVTSPVYRTVLANLLRTPRALITTTAAGGLLLPSNPAAQVASVPAGYFSASPAANDFNGTAGQLPLDFSRAGSVLLQQALRVDSVNFQGEHRFIKDRLEAYTEIAWRYQTASNRYPGVGGNMSYAANHPLNPFRANPAAGRPAGIAVNLVWNPVDLPFDSSDSRQRTLRLVGGLKGRLGEKKSWAWAVDYSYDRNEAYSLVWQYSSSLNDAANLGVYDPFRDLAVRPNTVPLDQLASFNTALTIPEIYVANVRVSGELWEWRAGRIGLSFGGESRLEDIKSVGRLVPAPVRVTNNPTGVAAILPGSNGRTNSSRESRGAYAELNVPLAGKDFRLPLVEELELSLAARHESYGRYSFRSTFGAGVASAAQPSEVADTPLTAALLWKPVRDIALRASYSDTFVSPTMTQFFNPRNTTASSLAQTVFDPVVGATVSLLPGTYQVTSGGNLSLKPESGHSVNVGVIFTPRWLTGFTASADVFRVVSDNQIRFPTLQTVISFFPERVTRNAANTITAYDQSFVNMSRVIVGGADFRVRWQGDVGRLGALDWQAGATYTDHYWQQAAVGGVFLHGVGDRTLDPGAPLRWKGSTSVTLTHGAWTAGVTARYVGEFKDIFNSNLSVPNTNGGVDGDHIRSQVEFDLRGSYEFGTGGQGWRRWMKGTKVTLGALNVLDRRPPYVSTNMGGAYYSYYNDPRMRYVYLEIRKRL